MNYVDMKRKILVIDDNPHILEAIQFALDTEGFKVKTLERSEGVEQEIQRFHPDLLLLDLLLSGRNGEEITRLLKKNSQTKKLPIIIISAHPTAQRIAHAAGADGFIAKPFNVNELLEHIESLLFLSQKNLPKKIAQ